VGKSFSTIPVPAVPVIRKGKSGSFYDKGLDGASHHAVIPNVNTIESLRDVWPRLSADEKKLFDVIARAYLATVMPDFRYRQTTATLDVGSFPFKATGRQHIDLGWRAAFPEWQPADEKGHDAQLLPQMRNGEAAQLRNPAIEDKETRPPPRYNEGTLIEAMQQAWRFVDDEVLRERLKEAKGIGTPATRAEIIGGLKRQGFLVVQGKNIVPTETGLSLFAVLQQADPALVDPGVTAQLECLLDDVVVGKQEMVGAIDAVCDVAQRIIGKLVEGPPGGVSPLAGSASDSRGGGRPPTAAMKRFVDSIARQKGIKPPAGYTKSGSVCSAFLDQHARRKTERVDGNAVNGPEARPPSQAQLSFAESISREKGISISDEAKANSAAMSIWIDTNQGEKPRKGHRETVALNSEQKVRKPTTRTKRPLKPKATATSVNSRHTSVTKQSNTAANTPLRVPYGNKEVAQQLGARYAAGAWYAPPGVDLTEFESKGWL
jgi:DNA topoisomerase-3